MKTNHNNSSEWRKWDLHIHSPASFFWKGGKKLSELSEQEKNAEIKKFIEFINQSDVTVFCLMDYWTFDWYLALQDYIEIYPEELKKTIFPGIELRIQSPTSYRLNIHCLLSDKLTKQNLHDFKSELYIAAIDKKLSNEALKTFALTLDESKAKLHGFSDPKTLSEDKLLELGSKTIEITQESLKNAFKQIPKNSGYILMPYDTSDGLLKLDWKTHPHADNYFMQSSHIFESRDQKNIDLINGVETEENRPFFENFFKTLGGKAKPCISGSDAHAYTEYGIYPSDRITWIKADPSFEGLKQIIHEPRLRVRIQSSKPDYKNPLEVIEKVTFISDDKNFNPAPIYLSQDLNVIIGGKSSGKSILLYNIASTIDPSQTQERLLKGVLNEDEKRKIKVNDKYELLTKNPNYDFEVSYLSGDKMLLHKNSNKQSRISNILFIPQNYLHQLSEPDGKKTRSELVKVIKQLLIENPVSNKRYEEFKTKKDNIIKIIENLVSDYFNTCITLIDLNKKSIEMGDFDAITKYIGELNKQIRVLKEKSGLNPEDSENYEKWNLELKIQEKKLHTYVSEKENISIFNENVLRTLDSLKSKRDSINSQLENLVLKNNFKLIYDFLEDFEKSISKFNSLLFENEVVTPSNIYYAEYKSITNEISRLEKLLEPVFADNIIKLQIEDLNKKISQEQTKLHEIEKFKKTINSFSAQRNQIYTNIFTEYGNLINEHKLIISVLNERGSQLEISELKLSGFLKFYNSRFKEIFKKNVDRRSISNQILDLYCLNHDNDDDLDLNEQVQSVQSLFNSIMDDKVPIKSDSSKKVLINHILSDFFFDYWEVFYREDEIGKMSAGKAGLVLLKLIIELSESYYPILIDQPEDNLDNRSITKELVEYLRTKKSKRQIIIVTHNANIVVNADAENVIVANQKGQDDNRENSDYQFDYITGALENTFELTVEEEKNILRRKGIREHVTEVLEGGKEAFITRERKYSFEN